MFIVLVFSEEEIAAIVDEFGFKIGKLPVRYLEVPLVTRKLTLTDCEPLMKKLRDRGEG